MTFCPEHPPKFTPLSETTSIPAAFIWESPPRNLFTSKYHQRDFCKKAGCCNVTNNEATKIAKQTYKFTKERCHFVLQLRWGGLFMLKARVSSACCAKNMTRLILKISRQFLTRSPVNDFTHRSLKITTIRHNI